MALNRVKELLSAGKPAFACIATIASPQVVQVLARSGFDLILIDLEHGLIDLATAHAMILATAGTDAVPTARIAANSASLAKPLLDAGVLGIAVPMVCTRAEAEAAAAAVRYPPLGTRMWGPFYAPLRWNLPMGEYMRAADEDILSMITIEHIDAVRNIDDIMRAEGVDVAIIGPGDMATSMGHRDNVQHPDVQAAMLEAERGILQSKVALGGVAFSPAQANDMIQRGYKLIALGFDWSLLMKGARLAFEGIQRP